MQKLRHSRYAPSFMAHAGLAIVAIGLAIGVGASCGGSVGGGTGATGTTSTNNGGTNAGGATSTGSTTSTTTTTSNTGGSTPTTCSGDADCVGDPKGAFCDTASGACVKCLPTNDTCPAGQYCDAASNKCGTGCKADADCAGDPNGAVHCSPQTHKCVNCIVDDDCPAGQLCFASGNVCIPGCSPTHDCPAGLSCCGSTCHDLATDFNHCGDCAKECTHPINGTGECKGGMCGLKACLPAFDDCNGNSMDGCEWNQLQDGPCLCTPGTTQPCYQGAPGTMNVGPCKAGIQTCDASGTSWGACIGQVLPISEVCGNGVDEDCDNVVDNVPDQDGDGWTICNGDCCDVAGQGCSNPKLVNPGAFEVVGDGVDNDCDPNTSDTVQPALCSNVQKFTGVTAGDVASAMDLCQTTTANPPMPMKKWGLIGASHLLANGAVPNATQLTNMQNWQSAVLLNYGTGGIIPKRGNTMAGLSSGKMRDQGDSGYDTLNNLNSGTSFNASASVAPPTVYTSANGGGLNPGVCAGMTCATGSQAFDSVAVRLQIRVPTNAQGFSYDFRFFSAEYQTYQCTSFNDYYLALLTSNAPGIPADHNISFDALNNPVSVNNGFFQVCPGNSKNCGPCPGGTAELAGTGLQLNNTGGGTLWLTTDAPVVGGETIILDLMIFDVNDSILDSLVILDNFRWSLTPVTLGTHT